MPNDTEFTHSLFDNTALSGWSPHTLQPSRSRTRLMRPTPTTRIKTATLLPAADTVVRGSNFFSPATARCPRLARACARHIAAITLFEGAGTVGPRPDRRREAQLLRFIGFRASKLA